MICTDCILIASCLLLSANAAPILLQNLLGLTWSQPIDGGYTLADGRALFGSSKTWRGLFCAMIASAMLAPIFKLTVIQGALFALSAMAGDLLSSFIKRRLKRPVSSRFHIVDTLPESLIPIVLFKQSLGMSFLDIIVVVLLFYAVDVGISPLLYRLHIRKRPY